MSSDFYYKSSRNIPGYSGLFEIIMAAWIKDSGGIQRKTDIFLLSKSTDPTKVYELSDIAKSLNNEQLDNLIILAKGLRK